MAIVAQSSASMSLSIREVGGISSATKHVISRLPTSSFIAPSGLTFATGFPLLISRTPRWAQIAGRRTSASVRCEQSTQEGNNLDVWLGRFAMVGFAVAISVEIATGKGLLENFGLTTPLPTVAFALTGVVGVLTAVFIFQSASKN